MDINELLVDSKLPLLRKEVTERYSSLAEIGDILNNKLFEVIKSMGEEFLYQFKEFFRSYNFEISEEGANKITVENELSKIEFDLDYEEGNLTFFLKKKDGSIVMREIKIQPNFGNEERLYWKKNIHELVSNEEISDIVNDISDTKKLEEILNSLQINIDWYTETVQMFEEIQFIYVDPNTDKEISYQSFKEFFESI